MRLTLRTLLAWLDDTLSPAEVRDIGKQVSESPFAQELVERIHRVARQRRLTVPNSAGSDATDPNLVASYLDNELDQDLVPEYEKLCLTSDVHMAEVASVHQILSLVGQKAKVPTEAKNRMYHLVRGRETVAPRQRRAPQPAPPEPEPDLIRPWDTPPPPVRPWLERFGPAAAALLLIALLGWSAWMSLKQSPQQTLYLAGPVNPKDARPAPVDKSAKPDGSLKAEAKPQPARPEPDAATGTAKGEGMPETSPKDETGKESTPKPDLPPGIVGMTEKPDGVLLRFVPDQREWDQVMEPSPLKSQDRLLSLDPFRSTLVLGSAKVDLVGETEVLIGSASPDEAARFQFAQGRVVLHGGPSPLPFQVQFAGRNIRVTPPVGVAVGVERVNRFEPGNPASSGSVLRVYGTEGDVAVEVDDAKETLNGAGSIVWDGGKWIDKSDKPGPSWVTEAKPTAYEVQIGAQFLKFFRPNRKVMADIVEAIDDDEKDVRRLAIRALKAVGDLSFLVPVLNTADDPTSRREAIRVLRSALAQGPDAAKALHDQLVRDLGDDQAKTVEKLLVGYTPKEAREDATFSDLVLKLSASEVGVRELALDNLRSLTGRDNLEFDPDKPDGLGLRAWKELLRNHELRPAGSLGKAEK